MLDTRRVISSASSSTVSPRSVDRSAREDRYRAVGPDGLSAAEILMSIDFDLNDILNAKPIGSTRFGAKPTYNFFSKLPDRPAARLDVAGRKESNFAVRAHRLHRVQTRTDSLPIFSPRHLGRDVNELMSGLKYRPVEVGLILRRCRGQCGLDIVQGVLEGSCCSTMLRAQLAKSRTSPEEQV